MKWGHNVLYPHSDNHGGHSGLFPTGDYYGGHGAREPQIVKKIVKSSDKIIRRILKVRDDTPKDWIPPPPLELIVSFKFHF